MDALYALRNPACSCEHGRDVPHSENIPERDSNISFSSRFSLYTKYVFLVAIKITMDTIEDTVALIFASAEVPNFIRMVSVTNGMKNA